MNLSYEKIWICEIIKYDGEETAAAVMKHIVVRAYYEMMGHMSWKQVLQAVQS